MGTNAAFQILLYQATWFGHEDDEGLVHPSMRDCQIQTRETAFRCSEETPFTIWLLRSTRQICRLTFVSVTISNMERPG